MKPYNESGIRLHDCPKCGVFAKPEVKYVSVAESPPTTPFLWITCKTCGHGAHMEPKDRA